MEIMTSRMLINLYKAHKGTVNTSLGATAVQPIKFVSRESEEFGHEEVNTRL